MQTVALLIAIIIMPQQAKMCIVIANYYHKLVLNFYIWKTVLYRKKSFGNTFLSNLKHQGPIWTDKKQQGL